MAITTPVLGGTTLPQVGADGYDERPLLRGVQTTMANGALATDLTSSTVKRKFELRWKLLSEAEASTVVSAWSAMVVAGSAAFTSPLGGTYTVTHDDQLELTTIWQKLTRTGALGDLTLRLQEV